MHLNFHQFINKYGSDTTTNIQLIKWAKQLKIANFHYCMIDEILSLKSAKLPIYIICNYQTSEEEGSHHIAIYKDKNIAYHFDSYGIEPPKQVVEFIKYKCENCYSSTFQIQQLGSRLCGQISLFFYTIFMNVLIFLILFYRCLKMFMNSGGIDIGGRPPPTSGGTADLTPYIKTTTANQAFINATGDVMSGNFDMGGFRITGLALPTTSNEAVTKSYCDSIATQVSDSDYVAKLSMPANTSGGNLATMHNITLPSTVPSGITNARIYLSAIICTFVYTDEVFTVSIRNYSYTSSTRLLSIWLNTLRTDNPGGTWSATTYVALLRIKLLTSDITTVSVTDSGIIPYVEKYLKLTGGTMSGDINMSTKSITAVKDPTSAQHAATKNYVDKLYPNSTSFILGSNDTTQGNSGSSRAFSKVTEDSGTTATLYINNNGDFSGGVRIGSKVNMNSNIITNLANPVSSYDAATKSYVDNKISSNPSSLITAIHARWLDYNVILKDYWPKFWVSPFYANGNQLGNGLVGRDCTADISGNGLTRGTGTPYSTIIDPEGNSYINMTAASSTIYVQSTFSFAGIYTFFIIASRNVPASTYGRVITSASGNKVVGWW